MLRDNEYDDRLTDWSAARVSMEFVKRWKPGIRIVDVVRAMQSEELVRGDLVVPEFAEGFTPIAREGPTEDAEERRLRERAEWREERDRLRRERDRRRYGSVWPLLAWVGLAA